MDPVTIRPAREDDFPRLIELYGELYALLRAMGIPFDLDEEGLKSLLPVILKSKMCYLAVAEQKGDVCGFISAVIAKMDRKLRYKDSRLVAKVNDICVEESHRGRNVAQSLLQSAEAWMKESGAVVCESEVALENGRSLGFFQRNGYKPFCDLLYKEL